MTQQEYFNIVTEAHQFEVDDGTCRDMAHIVDTALRHGRTFKLDIDTVAKQIAGQINARYSDYCVAHKVKNPFLFTFDPDDMVIVASEIKLDNNQRGITIPQFVGAAYQIKYDRDGQGYKTSIFEDYPNLCYIEARGLVDLTALMSNTSMESIFLNIDSSRATAADGCFLDSKIKQIYFGNMFNTSRLISASSMFENCTELTELNLGASFSTSSLIDASYFLYGCINLRSIDFGPAFFGNNLRDAECMIANCPLLNRVGASNKFLYNLYNPAKAHIFKDAIDPVSSLSTDTIYATYP